MQNYLLFIEFLIIWHYCSKPAYEMDKTNPDWVPMLHMGHYKIPASNYMLHTTMPIRLHLPCVVEEVTLLDKIVILCEHFIICKLYMTLILHCYWCDVLQSGFNKKKEAKICFFIKFLNSGTQSVHIQ